MKKHILHTWNVLLCMLLVFFTSCSHQHDWGKEQSVSSSHATQDAPVYDLKTILAYRSPYMGDNSNMINLFNSLPYAEKFSIQFELFPDTHSVKVHYTPHAELSHDDRMAMMLYNATAAFALIDNLEEITFVFPQMTHWIGRQFLQNFYGMPLDALLDENTWYSNVVERIKNKQFPEAFALDWQ